MLKDKLKTDIYDGNRISPDQAITLFEWNTIELGMAADYRRKLIHPQETIGFIIDRIINYSNVCEAQCAFCAYHAHAGRIEAYQLSNDQICQKIDELVKAGGTQVMLQGGLHPDYSIDFYIDMIQAVKRRFPNIYLHSFSPSELIHIARKTDISLDELVSALKSAGLDSVPGASDLLVEKIRTAVSPKKCTVAQWCEVIETLAKHSMKSSATMTYGMGETLAERIEHLMMIRDIQDKTGILRAFIPWSFSPANTRLEHILPATGVDYLKIVAIARIFLDNVRFIQAGWLTEGPKLAQIALTMGANDMGGVLTEETVVRATGIETGMSITDMIDMIINAGKIPVQRDSNYLKIKDFNV